MATGKLDESWPRPRIGQFVRLRKNGKLAEVVLVQKARDVLRGMTELDAILLSPKCQALYGVHWLEIYYEAQVRLEGTETMITVTPNEVEQVIDVH